MFFYVLGITVSVLIVFFFQLMLQVAHGQWNHLDFLWGRDVRTLLYDQMLAVSILFVNFENCKLFELLP